MTCENTRDTRHDKFHAARSRHPGGVNAIFADGYVIFTSDTIDLVIWQRLASINIRGLGRTLCMPLLDGHGRRLPPVDAFWLVTMCDEKILSVPNPVNRFVVGDRGGLRIQYRATGDPWTFGDCRFHYA